jgi:ligand-binding sensor domain-containing protein/two-component sensor histidine kinase
MRLKISLILLINFILPGFVLSQSPIRLPFNKKITINEGLSSYNIKKIVQDKYGFIWIATQDGLNRYDGKSFIVYSKSSEEDYKLSGNDVWDMEEDSNSGILWIVTAYGGINGINLQTAKVCISLPERILKEGPTNDWLRCIKVSGDHLWIGTYDGLAIYNTRTKIFERFSPIPFLKNQNTNFSIDNIFIDRNGNIWLFIANYGVVIYSAHTRTVINYYLLTSLSLKHKPVIKQFNSVTPLSQEVLLIGTDQGFRRIKYDKKGITTVFKGLFDNDNQFRETNIKASNVDSFQNIWFATSSKLFKADANHTIREVKDCNLNIGAEWLNYVYAIFFDKQNNIWLGTSKGVIYTKNSIPVFTPYFISEDLTQRIDHAFYIYPYNDSIIYVGTETEFLKINIVQNKIISLDKGRFYYFINEHADKNLLVSNEKGFFVYKPKKGFFDISDYYPELAPVNNTTINSMTYVGDSLTVIGTEALDGFYVWNFKKRLLKKIEAGEHDKDVPTNIVNTSYKDAKNRIWVLGDDIISILDPFTNKTKNIKFINPANKLPYSIFFDICEAKGYYWIAAYGTGLIQIDDSFNVLKTYSVKEGLSNAGVYKLFSVNDSLIFITSNNGLSVFNLNTSSFNNYYQGDGLNSNSFEEGCGIYKNGKIYVGGVNGFTIIDPEYFSTNRIPPQLYLNTIKIKTTSDEIDTTNIFLTSIKIPKNVLETTVSFSALNYINPARTIFAYRIKELNNDWVSMGTQNFVSLIGLNPGKYTLQVKCANEDNVWNDKPLEISLFYLPKWYQTSWFKLVVLITVAGLLYSLYRYRLGQIKKRERIRQHIARDLHDEIGSSLTTVKAFTQLAKHTEHKEGYLIQIEDLVNHTYAALKDIVWVLDDSADTIDEFTERIRKFALPLSKAKNIHLKCSVEENIGDQIFSKPEKRNLLMIAKETINNSIKYAECANIKTSIMQVNRKTALIIEDDGKGFDVSTASEGNGLKNIVSRAKQIGYTAEIISSEGKGAMVRVVRK